MKKLIIAPRVAPTNKDGVLMSITFKVLLYAFFNANPAPIVIIVPGTKINSQIR